MRSSLSMLRLTQSALERLRTHDWPKTHHKPDKSHGKKPAAPGDHQDKTRGKSGDAPRGKARGHDKPNG